MNDFVDSLSDSLQEILKVRDELGLSKAEVAFVKRTWSGKRPGEGKAKDVKLVLIPTPTIVDYSQRLSIVQAGAIQQGDLILNHISKEALPRDDLMNYSTKENVQTFWQIGGALYKGQSVKDEIFYWSVQVRPISGG